eukprot:Plantae.Rhodophyta-Hildenbrandia_rubra.ctg14038.p1 GENE.Plantae.Rhodophyta-Hildenbrandia_rubra.ctg14038~~Plantae.Rhodophyta-Hildenbrandia_rubra.ctg14038.p1  ORF type:complete len:383 (+),score=58.79 Plantae.Rhodophyta-Hildenbrandia_rubra.ctg14038:373-1521(+)
MSDAVSIDLSEHVNGGHATRAACGMGAILGCNVHLSNVLTTRKRPGLSPQHVAGIATIAKISVRELTGCYEGSSTVSLTKVDQKNDEIVESATKIDVSIRTAGAVTLALHGILPVALRFNSSGVIHIRGGGTMVSMAPPTSYFNEVFAPNMERFGVSVCCKAEEHGLFPEGGALAQCEYSLITENCISENGALYLKAVDFTQRGRLVKVSGKAFASKGLPMRALDDMVSAAKAGLEASVIQENCSAPVEIEDVLLDAKCGAGKGALTLFAHMSSGCVLGAWQLKKKGWSYRRTGEESAIGMCDVLSKGEAIDMSFAEQLIVFMVMARGESRMRIRQPSSRLQVAVTVARMFGVDVTLEEERSRNGTLILAVKGKSIPVGALR